MLGILVCALAAVAASTQKRRSRSPGGITARERIAQIISQRLNEGRSVVKGVRVQTKTPPSPEAIDEIKRYGDDAVPILSEYLSAKDAQVRTIAVEFIGLLGGRRIITPLQKVIRSDDSPTVRVLALRWASQAPWELVAPVIREAARADADPRVREEANRILAMYDHK
jgi:hypothetical protein